MQFTWRFGAGLESIANIIGAGRGVALSPLADGAGATLMLPDIPAGHIIVPSFCALTAANYAFRFTLAGAGGEAALAGIGSALAALPAAGGGGVEAPIDNFITRAATTALRLRLHTHGLAADARWLLTVSVRPLDLPAAAPGSQVAATQVVAPLSQWGHADAALRGRICLPTCTTMALRALGRDADFERVVAACRHGSGLYGVWPLSLHTASRMGIVGSVEVFTHLDDLVPLLRAGCAIAASVRFRNGELDGAPLAETAGHLLLVRGLDRERVFVNDPAAPDDGGVARDYARTQFANIWLRHRGAACVFLP